MSIFSIFRKKDARNNHDFTEEDRIYSLELRKAKAELRKQQFEIEKLELEAKKEELQQIIEEMKGGEEEDSTTKLILAMLAPALLKNNQSSASIPTPQLVHYEAEQLKGMLAYIPPSALKIAKKMDNTALGNMIKGYLPNIDNESIDNAIRIIKEEV